jgi:hypothetical protein
VEQTNLKEGFSKKGLFLLGALGLTALVLISLPKKISVISIGNIYAGKDKEK